MSAEDVKRAVEEASAFSPGSAAEPSFRLEPAAKEPRRRLVDGADENATQGGTRSGTNAIGKEWTGGPSHPLARFIDLRAEACPPRWVIPGFIASGVVVIAGSPGVGKTTAMLPLALVAAGLHAPDDPLAPRHWRHVVYITEDVEQAMRVMAGIRTDQTVNVSKDVVSERMHIAPAQRMEPERVAAVGEFYREQFTRRVGDVEVQPLVVLDTKSAVIAIDDENSNAEASRTMSVLKQGFAGLPVWIICHLSKANAGRDDVAALSSRGASAIDADATQTLFLVKEGESRYLIAGKTRFDPKWPELLVESRHASTPATDEFGNPESLTLRWSRSVPPTA